ncbi:MAG: metallophosphatase family protein [Muribaculaceae bacterium]|nr:metallophosphatase family protein [Muribaculaceae bacterium]
MKRIGILSDTHSHWDDKFSFYFADCDEIWHAGDIGDIDLLDRLRGIGPTLRAVRGNVDHGEVSRQCPELLIFDIEQTRVLLTHIGGYPGRWAPGMKKLLREEKINLMVDGHSHLLKVIYDKELHLLHINPGAAGRQGWQQKRTILRLTIDGNDIRDCEVIELA